MSSSRSARALRAVPSAPAPVEEEQDAADDPRRQEIERTLDAFRSLLPPDALEALREDMLGFATTHPVMKEIWNRAKPRPVPDASGVVATEKGK